MPPFHAGVFWSRLSIMQITAPDKSDAGAVSGEGAIMRPSAA
jgi:hypothetical protein